MSDLHDDVVRLAIAAAGPVGNNEAAWRHRVDELTPQIAAMFRPPLQGRENDAMTPAVTARKVLDASVFTGEYVDHALEDSSKRLVVRIKSETTDTKEKESDGTEHIRTEPMWTPYGRLMKSKLDQLVTGQKVTCFKHLEQIDASRKVRVLVHLVPGKRPEGDQERPTVEAPPSSAPPAGRAEVGSNRRPPTSAPPSQSGITQQRSDTTTSPSQPVGSGDAEADMRNAHAVEEAMKDLPNMQKVAVRAMCQGQKIKNWAMPSDEDLDRVLLIISNIKKGES
jgi:hypothetical protein